MNGYGGKSGISRETLAELKKVRAWAAKQAGIEPVALFVLDDLTERIEQYRKLAALVSIRAKNRGTSPSERARNAARQAEKDAKQGRRDSHYRSVIPYLQSNERPFGVRLWTLHDHDRLRALFAENLSDEAIGEQLDRTPGAVREARRKIGLHRPHDYSVFATIGGVELRDQVRGIWSDPTKRGRKNLTPLQRVMKVAKERRQQEGRERIAV